MSWKKISTKTVYKNRWMRVTEDQVETQSGKRLLYGVVHKNPYALVIPWDGKRFTLVGQYRYPINTFTWEFPQGHLECDSIRDSARCELKEETGLTAKTIRKIGMNYVADGYSNQECHVFLATGLTQGDHDRDDSEEDMIVKKVSVLELERMIAGGEIKDGPTIAAYAYLKIKAML